MRIFTISQNQDITQMTQDEFVNYHRTSTIPPIKNVGNSFKWYKKENYQTLLDTKQFGSETVEFRKSDNQDYDLTRIVVFIGDKAIGVAAEHYSLDSLDQSQDGIWVEPKYQRMGIGTYLLWLFRKQFDADRKIGMMTDLGEKMTRKYFDKLKNDKNEK